MKIFRIELASQQRIYFITFFFSFMPVKKTQIEDGLFLHYVGVCSSL